MAFSFVQKYTLLGVPAAATTTSFCNVAMLPSKSPIFDFVACSKFAKFPSTVPRRESVAVLNVLRSLLSAARLLSRVLKRSLFCVFVDVRSCWSTAT